MCKADTELVDLAPASLLKLNSEKVNGDVTKLSKKEICAVSFRFFRLHVQGDQPKAHARLGLAGPHRRAARRSSCCCARCRRGTAAAPAAEGSDNDEEDEDL